MLLHVCCAPCSPYVVRTLTEDYDLTLYFYNPNIHPENEYAARLKEVSGWADSIGVPLITGEYDPQTWFKRVEGLEDEPERGQRCGICFETRLSATARKAGELGLSVFGTVLSVSPHKDSIVINRVGKEAALAERVGFFEADWKKKDGYKITTRMAREAGFYRQDYCGCVFSRRGREKMSPRREFKQDFNRPG